MSDKPAYMKHMPHFLGPVAPITLDHAEGSWVYDTEGGKWLDFVMGIAVMNTGHCHPKVVKAVQEQAAMPEPVGRPPPPGMPPPPRPPIRTLIRSKQVWPAAQQAAVPSQEPAGS